jgi:hypothetical protein
LRRQRPKAAVGQEQSVVGPVKIHRKRSPAVELVGLGCAS